LLLYQALTTVELGNGTTTLFWSDVWLGDEALEERFPRLFSHCVKTECTVQQAILSDLQGHFVNRKSLQAQSELQQLHDLLLQVQLSDQPDRRLSALSHTNDKLDMSAVYKLLKA
jgi:hypothetical protein